MGEKEYSHSTKDICNAIMFSYEILILIQAKYVKCISCAVKLFILIRTFFYNCHSELFASIRLPPKKDRRKESTDVVILSWHLSDQKWIPAEQLITGFAALSSISTLLDIEVDYLLHCIIITANEWLLFI